MDRDFTPNAVLAAAVLLILGAVAPSAAQGLRDHQLRADVEARNAAYEQAHPGGALAQAPASDLDALDVHIACAPVDGVVDKAACAAATDREAAFRRALPPT